MPTLESRALPRARPTRHAARALVLALIGMSLFAGMSPAAAAEGSIDHVESKPGKVQVLFSVPQTSEAADPDLSSVTVSLDGTSLDATAEVAAKTDDTVRRTAVLAIDVSNSMREDKKFVEAKAAASAFLAAAPEDLYIGIVIFAGTVEVAQEPTLDRAASNTVIDGLELALGTRLYDGVSEAVALGGEEGQRSVLVLSDGRDTSETPITDLSSEIEDAEAIVDVVALAQDDESQALLEQIAVAGAGKVIAADDPAALSQVFTDEARLLARQLLVTAVAPADLETEEGTLEVTVAAGGESYSDSAFVTVNKAAAPSTIGPSTNLASPDVGFTVPSSAMYGGIAALALGGLVLVVAIFGGFGSAAPATVESRISPYTRAGAGAPGPAKPVQQQSVGEQALGMAQKALDGNKGLESKLGGRLDAAGMSLKPAEWLLTHTGLAFLFSIAALLLSGGSILYALLGLFLGAVGPWLYLGFKKRRRLKAFRSQLADTLQLISGSLSAGLSLAQSIDTVVREGAEPVAGEFRRALVEARLGIEIEDALEDVGARMESRDFEWVVMAIRIQREVGGNLAELLKTVAATIREREYLERQVLALSAEGRLSVWLLGGLPPGFMLYLMMANPSYLEPLFNSVLGYMLLGVMAVLLTVGIFWMKKLVKVDV